MKRMMMIGSVWRVMERWLAGFDGMLMMVRLVDDEARPKPK